MMIQTDDKKQTNVVLQMYGSGSTVFFYHYLTRSIRNTQCGLK